MKRIREKTNLQAANDAPWTSVDFCCCLQRARNVQEQILQACEKIGFPEHDLFALKLALEEALVNACKHGNKMDPCKHVKVHYRITRQRADITIEDEGAGFNPAELPDPTADENLERANGRGILLMRAYMSNVVFNPQGNKVTLTKFNEAAPAVPPATQPKAAMG